MMSLIDLLPPNYKNSPDVVELQEALDVQVEAIRAAKEDLFNQFDVMTATWGLTLWEKAYGIKPDLSKPYDYRRARILSKMRGQGSVTKAMIKNVAESFTYGLVEVTENPAEYSFTIAFVDKHGIPPNLDDLKVAIEEIKPAHLAVNYVLRYLIWDELDAAALTWDALDAKALTWDEFELGGWLDA